MLQMHVPSGPCRAMHMQSADAAHPGEDATGTTNYASPQHISSCSLRSESAHMQHVQERQHGLSMQQLCLGYAACSRQLPALAQQLGEFLGRCAGGNIQTGLGIGPSHQPQCAAVTSAPETASQCLLMVCRHSCSCTASRADGRLVWLSRPTHLSVTAAASVTAGVLARSTCTSPWAAPAAWAAARPSGRAARSPTAAAALHRVLGWCLGARAGPAPFSSLTRPCRPPASSTCCLHTAGVEPLHPALPCLVVRVSSLNRPAWHFTWQGIRHGYPCSRSRASRRDSTYHTG